MKLPIAITLMILSETCLASVPPMYAVCTNASSVSHMEFNKNALNPKIPFHFTGTISYARQAHDAQMRTLAVSDSAGSAILTCANGIRDANRLAPGATAEISVKAPAAKIILLTTFGTSDGIAHALANGATGAILKDADNTQLAAAIRKVASGGEYVSQEIRQQLAVDPPIPELTPRQRDVLGSMVRGLTDHDMARQFGIRQDGVNDHVRAILAKLGAANRTEAVAIALRKHLLKA